MMYKIVAPTAEYSIMQPERIPFRQWFRRQLSEQRLSQAEFSRRSGVSTGRVSEWLSGKSTPDATSAEKIARGLNFDTEVVMRALGLLEDDPYAPDPESPASLLCAMVRRVEWDPGRYELAESMLRTFLEQDRRARQQGQDSSPPSRDTQDT